MSPPGSDELQPQFMGDLSTLPPHAHGNRSLTWWGMMGMIAIEGTAFVLAVATYFYLANQSTIGRRISCCPIYCRASCQFVR